MSALATTRSSVVELQLLDLYTLPLQRLAEQSLTLIAQYAKPGQTSTAYDPYATNFQYIIDSFIAPKYGDYIYIGCYYDPGILLSERALTNKSANTNVGSMEGCATFCEGFTYFGLENGNECTDRLDEFECSY